MKETRQILEETERNKKSKTSIESKEMLKDE